MVSPGTACTKSAHEPSPDAVVDSENRAWSLESLKGKPAVVHFWATWCAPCLEELPLFLDEASRWKGKGVQFVAVSLDTSWPVARKILKDTQAKDPLSLVLDPKGRIPESLGTYQYPETYLLDSQGRVLKKWVGAQDWGSEGVRGLIQAAGRASEAKI